jgi:hypothetical protein
MKTHSPCHLSPQQTIKRHDKIPRGRSVDPQSVNVAKKRVSKIRLCDPYHIVECNCNTTAAAIVGFIVDNDAPVSAKYCTQMD